MQSEVGDKKLASPDFADDSVVNVVVVLNSVHTHDCESTIFGNGRSNALIVRGIQGRIEGHCDEASARCPASIWAISLPTLQSQCQAIAVDLKQLLLEKRTPQKVELFHIGSGECRKLELIVDYNARPSTVLRLRADVLEEATKLLGD
jgi:hypothetical protein